MKRNWIAILLAMLLAGLFPGCAHRNPARAPHSENLDAVSQALETVRLKHAPNPHLAIFQVTAERAGQSVVLTGDVDTPAAKAGAVAAVQRAGFVVKDRIRVLPAEELGDAVWGIASLSVASGRELPDHKAELGTQILLGHAVRVWKSTGGWYLVQSSDRYLSYIGRGSFVRCTREQVEEWNRAPLLMITALEDRILEEPHPAAQPVSDVVVGGLVRRIGEAGDWFRVELPDKRSGYLPKHAATDYVAWKASCEPSAENIERTARQFLGRPYLWGGNSPKGLDCSGFTKLVYFMNGVDLNRNASHQAWQGKPVPMDPEFSQLRKGDLLFFGARGSRGQPNRVTHVGIYLGDKLFIHSADRVRVNSLDPQSPIGDVRRLRTLLEARRVLPES